MAAEHQRPVSGEVTVAAGAVHGHVAEAGCDISSPWSATETRAKWTYTISFARQGKKRKVPATDLESVVGTFFVPNAARLSGRAASIFGANVFRGSRRRTRSS